MLGQKRKAAAEDLEQTARLAALAVYDKPGLIEEAFGLTLWERQREIVESFFGEPETVVRSCHSSGKTLSLAACAVLAPIIEPECIVITLSASWEQVEKTVWTEMHRLRAMLRIAGQPPMLKTEWTLGPKRFAVGLSPDNPTRLQGFHAEKVRILVDETAGIENAELFEALNSLRAALSFDAWGQPNITVVYSMNPTRAAGPEVNLFYKPSVKALTIDAFRSPNFWLDGQGRYITEEELLALPLDRQGPLDRMVRAPYLITPRYAREVYEENGKGPASPWWARVRGVFPQQDLDSLFLQEWVQRAARDPVQRDHAAKRAHGPVVIGLDVAGPGDDETAFYARRGPLVIGRGAWREPDPERAKNVLLAQLEPYLREPGTVINIDSVVIGHYLALYLRQLGLQVTAMNAGERAYDAEHYANRKAEWYWGFRERLQQGDVAGDIDEVTQQQLANVLYERNARNQILIEPKRAARKRGLRSPDRAEALIMAFAGTPARKQAQPYRFTDIGPRDVAPHSKWLAARRKARWQRVEEAMGE